MNEYEISKIKTLMIVDDDDNVGGDRWTYS